MPDVTVWIVITPSKYYVDKGVPAVRSPVLYWALEHQYKRRRHSENDKMGSFLLIAAAIVGSALAANALLNVLGRSGGPIFVGATFAVVGAGAYAAAFVFDMITLAWAGELPSANVVWPCFTWSLISCCSLAVGAGRPAPFAARATPFWLVGGLALLSSLAHPRNVVAAIALILGGIVYPTLAAQRGGTASGTSEGRGEPKVRRGLAPTLGPYHLDMKTADASGLVELTPAEKKALNTAIEFRNERIPSFRLGSNVRFDPAAISKWLLGLGVKSMSTSSK